MEYCRLQIGCLLFVAYIGFIYFRDCKKYGKTLNGNIFDEILILSMITIVFDGITAVTVNHLDVVNPLFNRLMHLGFLIGVVTVIYMMFGYIVTTTGAQPDKKWKRMLLHIPYISSLIVIVANIGSLEYLEGKYTNYSMGVSAYACFGMIGIYFLLTLIVFFRRWNYIDVNKRSSILTYLLIVGGIAIIQAAFPEVLLTSLVAAVLVLGIYMNQEDPILNEVSRYHNEMVMSFATLVENKDGSTGGHIKRTTAYVKLLSEEIKKRGYYKDVLTKDYIQNLCQSAPMHDIGKIAVPDVVLQKPGKLTDEEFDIIKKHTVNGGNIIKETFGNLGDEEYTDMAYQVARYHHEKWNGKGYPEGLKEDEIPLCARIMAVADVFDAISEKRCYRDAMEMDQCFDIISEGSGRDFDPIVAGVFLEIRAQVEKIHSSK